MAYDVANNFDLACLEHLEIWKGKNKSNKAVSVSLRGRFGQNVTSDAMLCYRSGLWGKIRLELVKSSLSLSLH
jgi:hypothetical protein